MPPLRIAVLLAAAGLLSAPPAHAARMNWSCYGQFASVLERRGFPGADCSRARVKIGFLGAVHQGRDKYLVYQYGYEDDPNKIGGVQAHALKRILIFKNSTGDYLGNYVMDADFDADVRANRIHVRADKRDLDGTIEIGPHGPPKQAFYGGDLVPFDR
jgi:hypothetical protein